MSTGEDAAGRRSDAEHNDALILRAAKRMIIRDGGISSLTKVAREAGIGRSTTYRRFGSVQELESKASAYLICEELGPTIERAARGDDAFAGYRAIGHKTIQLVQKIPPARMSLADLVDEYIYRYQASLERIMRTAQQQGTLRGDFTSDDIPSFTAATLAAATMANLSSSAVDRYMTIVFQGLGSTGASALPEG